MTQQTPKLKGTQQVHAIVSLGKANDCSSKVINSIFMKIIPTTLLLDLHATPTATTAALLLPSIANTTLILQTQPRRVKAKQQHLPQDHPIS